MKIVLASYGSRGDVEPCVAVGRELLRRGHEVRMAVPPDKFGVVQAVGLTATPYGRDTREQMNTAMDFVRRTPNPMMVIPQITEHVSRVWSEKAEALTALAEGADLLVAGMNEQRLAANIAEFYRIPLAAVHYFPAQLMELGWLQTQITNEVAEAQRRTLGLPEATESSTPQPPQCAPLEIQAYEEFCLPELAAQWSGQGFRRPFVGALTLALPTDADDEVSSWIADGTPPIYFGFGSTPLAAAAHTVAMISAACTQLGERAVICSGPNDFSNIPHPDHVKVVDEVNHAAIFPACRAVVHHGGAGVTAASMRAGVPSLILWLWLDQPAWSEAVTALKIGAGQRFAVTTQESLVADLTSILTSGHVERAREVAAAMTKPACSLVSAADLLEDAARAGCAD